MDGCSTMEGDHNGLKVYFDKSTSHFTFIHCGNHRLAHCFAHLIPKFDEFKGFDSLLINFYQFFKKVSSNQYMKKWKQHIFYLQSLKFVKAVVTRSWQSSWTSILIFDSCSGCYLRHKMWTCRRWCARRACSRKTNCHTVFSCRYIKEHQCFANYFARIKTKLFRNQACSWKLIKNYLIQIHQIDSIRVKVLLLFYWHS